MAVLQLHLGLALKDVWKEDPPNERTLGSTSGCPLFVEITKVMNLHWLLGS